MPPNPFLLAADNSPALLPLLRSDPTIAAQQDEHGYSLIHAAASYNHLDLLKSLVQEFHAPVDLRDEDSETALFVVETVEAARVLVEELGLDVAITGDSGQTAREKIEEEGDFPDVVDYLRSREGPGGLARAQLNVNGTSTTEDLPPPPRGLSLTVGSMDEPDGAGDLPDPDFRRRIEELATRDDLNTPEGQAELRRLVEDAVADEDLSAARQVRPRQG